MNVSRRNRGGKRRPVRGITTKSGNKLRLNRSFSERVRANRAARKEQKALYLSTLPKTRWKRILYRLHPKRIAQYWFSREGAIMALKITGIGIVVCFFLILGAFAYFRKDLPQIKDISGDKLGGSITYYDRTGKVVLWQDYDAIKRIPVPSNDISKYMKDATVAIEDKNFYHEGAFSVTGTLRAGIHDVFGGGESLQGGSTITQQLVKLNENWTDNRTITRKVKELILAVELEREYSKDDILTGYLNIAPYGGIEYGVESAARDYFHSDAKDLTLAQAAMLASIPKSPTLYSPYSSSQFNPSSTGDYFDSQALVSRQHYVLDQMAQQGYITQDQANAAKKVDILSQIFPLTPKYQGIKAPYFVLAAKQQLEQKYTASTVQRSGWNVITSVDLGIQDKAEQIVAKNLPSVERAGGDEEAMVIEDVPTGQVVALVGGVDFNNPTYGQINFAASTLIAPGSSVKPYDYATLINNSSAGAGSVFYDSIGPIIDPATGLGYACTNKSLPPPEGNGNCLWDDNRTFPGPETIRYALGGSRNVPAVKAMIQAGVQKTINTASDMMDPTRKPGQLTYNCYSDQALTHVASCGPAAAIGDGAYLTLANHTNGLSTLARMGKALPQTYILKITNSSGQTVDQWSQSWANSHGKQVVDPQTAYIVNDMLSDPRASYFPAGTKIQHWNGWDFGIKTGTTNNASNYLMTGYSTQYAVVSWAGYHTTQKPMTGSSDTITYNMTAPMLEYLHTGKKPVNWQAPKGIQTLPAYVETSGYGDMFGAQFPSPSTDVYPSWYKPNKGSVGSQVIDKVSGKVATSCTPAAAKETITNGNPNSFSIDEFVNGGLKNQAVTGTDDVHNCGDLPPSVTLTVANGTNVCNITCTFTVTATASPGTVPLYGGNYTADPASTITISIGGNTVCNFSINSDPYSNSCTYTPTSTGSQQVVATVTDSILYQNTDNKTVDFTSGGGGNNITITNPSNGDTVSGGNIQISWSGGSGAGYIATVTGPSGFSSTCSSASGNSCNAALGGKGAYKVSVTDSASDNSQTINFTKGP